MFTSGVSGIKTGGGYVKRGCACTIRYSAHIRRGWYKNSRLRTGGGYVKVQGTPRECGKKRRRENEKKIRGEEEKKRRREIEKSVARWRLHK